MTNGETGYLPNGLILNGNFYFYDGVKYTLFSDSALLKSDSTYLYYTQRQIDSIFAESDSWTPVVGGINYAAGNVGINNATPTNKLDVAGTIKTDTLIINGVYYQPITREIENGTTTVLQYLADTIKPSQDLTTNTYVYTVRGESIVDTTNQVDQSNLNYFPYGYFSRNPGDCANYYGMSYGSTLNGNCSGFFQGFQNTPKFDIWNGESKTIANNYGFYNYPRGVLRNGATVTFTNDVIALYNKQDVAVGALGGTYNAPNYYGILSEINVDPDITYNIPDTSFACAIRGTIPGNHVNIGFSEKSGKNEYYSESKFRDTARFEKDIYVNGNRFTGFGSELIGVTSNTETFLGVNAGLDNIGDYNTFIGYNVAKQNTTGKQNVFLGEYSGESFMSNDDNVFIGSFTGRFNASAAKTVLVGSFAGYNSEGAIGLTSVGCESGYNSEGSGNTFLGYQSGYTNSTGANNTFIGYQSGYLNSTTSNNTYVGALAGVNAKGDYNTFLGRLAGRQAVDDYNTYLGAFAANVATTGVRNTFIGAYAGNSYTNGDSSIFIGARAGFYETGSAKLYIESGDATNPLVYGDFRKDSLAINGGLTVKESVYASAFNVDTTTDNNELLLNNNGFISSSNKLQWNDTTLTIKDAYDNIFIGTGSGVANTFGEVNIGLGLNSLSKNTLGNNNIAIGTSTLDENTIGENNVSIGGGSLTNNISGNYNTAIGSSVLGTTLTGNYNTAIGNGAGQANQTGSANTYLGVSAGNQGVLSDSNVMIGYRAGFYETLSNRLYITNSSGNNLQEGKSNALIYGEFDNKLLNVNGHLTAQKLTVTNIIDAPGCDVDVNCVTVKNGIEFEQNNNLPLTPILGQVINVDTTLYFYNGYDYEKIVTEKNDTTKVKNLVAEESIISIAKIYGNFFSPTDSISTTVTSPPNVYYFGEVNFIVTMDRGLKYDVDTIQIDRPTVDSVYCRIYYGTAVRANKAGTYTFGFSDNGGVWLGSEKSVTLGLGEKKSVTHSFDKWLHDGQDIKPVVKSTASNSEVYTNQTNINITELYTSDNYDL